MRRFLVAAVVIGCFGTQAQVGFRDRYFARYPFDRWQTEADKTQIRWAVRVRPAKLSAHQRLVAHIEIEVGEKEIANRRGHDEMIVLLEIEDAAGKRYRNHNGFNLAAIPAGVKPRGMTFYQDVFVVPGDYRLSFATCDSTSGEYSFTRRALHVAPLRGDGLALAGSDLPPVEFVRPLEAPDSWFQPNIRGRLKLGVDTGRPIHVDVVMNMTPSEHGAGPLHMFRRNMSVLVPALKVLAGMEVSRGTIDVTLLDLTTQRVWEQKDARGLDWMKMRAPLAANQPGVIDAQSLAAKAQMTGFFRDQVLGRAQRSDVKDELRVVIVLSAPAFLDHQFRLEPANVERDPNRKIFYLRYRPLPPRPEFTGPMPEGGAVTVVNSLPSDDLERALKALDARVLSSSTPEEFRKALSTMLADIQRM